MSAAERRVLRQVSPSRDVEPDAKPGPPDKGKRPSVQPISIALANGVAGSGDTGAVADEASGAPRPGSRRRSSIFFLDTETLLRSMPSSTRSTRPAEVQSPRPEDLAAQLEWVAGGEGRPAGGPRHPGSARKASKDSASRRGAAPGAPGDNEHIQVAVRVCPVLRGGQGGHEFLTVDPSEPTVRVDIRPDQTMRQKQLADSPASRGDLSAREPGLRAYRFDHVIDSRGSAGGPSFGSQERVYDMVGRRIVRSALEGFNACLFAYGQTGTGKTHTILGRLDRPGERGLIPRILEDLFAAAGLAESGRASSLQISYLEIFNEHIHDLLVPPKAGAPRDALQVRYHPTLGVIINDLTESSCSTVEEAMELVEFGTRMRSIASTSMNSRSSRAHTVFTFRFEQTAGDGETQIAQVQVVDLAGREQERRSGDNRERLRERQYINTSLFHLSTCIMNLSKAARGKSDSKAPGDFAFRNSKLTLLLAHSLGGNSRTAMIAAVSSASCDADETLSTLRFADAVKKIQTTVTSNRVNKKTLVEDLQEEISRLRAEMATRRAQPAGLLDQVHQLEAVCAHFKDAYEQEKSRSRALAAERAECLRELGLSVGAEGVSLAVGAGQEAGLPYLVNLSEDPSLQGCLMYFLHPGEVTVGSADSSRIRLAGVGILPHHCVIGSEGGGRLCLRPAEEPGTEAEQDRPRVFLNGRRVVRPTEMHHQDRLIIGHACAFQAVVPLAAGRLRDADAAPAELEQALAEIEDSGSQSFLHLRKYTEDLERCVGSEAAAAFVRELHRSVPLVDEANQITREVGLAGIHFSLQVLTDLWSPRTNAPEFVVTVLNKDGARGAPPSPRLGGGGAREEGALKFVWSFGKFQDRLRSMRDVYEEMQQHGARRAQARLAAEPYLDPWKEVSGGDVQVLLHGLRYGKAEPSPSASPGPSVIASPPSATRQGCCDEPVHVMPHIRPLNLSAVLGAKSDEPAARSRLAGVPSPSRNSAYNASTRVTSAPGSAVGSSICSNAGADGAWQCPQEPAWMGQFAGERLGHTADSAWGPAQWLQGAGGRPDAGPAGPSGRDTGPAGGGAWQWRPPNISLNMGDGNVSLKMGEHLPQMGAAEHLPDWASRAAKGFGSDSEVEEGAPPAARGGETDALARLEALVWGRQGLRWPAELAEEAAELRRENLRLQQRIDELCAVGLAARGARDRGRHEEGEEDGARHQQAAPHHLLEREERLEAWARQLWKKERTLQKIEAVTTQLLARQNLGDETAPLPAPPLTPPPAPPPAQSPARSDARRGERIR